MIILSFKFVFNVCQICGPIARVSIFFIRVLAARNYCIYTLHNFYSTQKLYVYVSWIKLSFFLFFLLKYHKLFLPIFFSVCLIKIRILYICLPFFHLFANCFIFWNVDWWHIPFLCLHVCLSNEPNSCQLNFWLIFVLTSC